MGSAQMDPSMPALRGRSAPSSPPVEWILSQGWLAFHPRAVKNSHKLEI